ncbi:hypothetical protein AKJ09_06587 [Labilithrix luteola]|uniref:Glycosyltransferase RgtA/B/C/D-like domain-containing protein n=1 Tax=Labilithrix luteola TaxID=1391654 RepID=A0A0K1Q2C8_9BACT|nr:hypothetical protein [Labilithrix luteola]AKU99923.1 hypothetical protein AKJ09_06587 [Labilithrix luteola]
MTNPTLAKITAVLGTWGKPPDVPAKVALGMAAVLALAALFGRGRSILGIGEHVLPRRLFLALTAFVTALLSLFWIAFYLRGGPRIVDATTYFLQGRALSHGDFAWPVLEPSASFRGRFLIYRDGVMGGIFPPGFPLLLAAGFTIGAPMIVGPLLAAGIVLATYRLARRFAEQSGATELAEPIARTAALFSMVSATLRYHTADTMSHGATALGIALALSFALERRPGLAGLAVGAVLATRPVSALPIGIVCTVILLTSAAPRRDVGVRALLGLLPGVVLLLASQKAVTGHWLESSQRLYYTLSDGPPGCFRFGFGVGTGCVNEHGEFVEARLPHGYGVLAAAGTTLRRLRMHLTDIANFEPLALLVFVPLLRPWRAEGSAGKPRRSKAVVMALVLVGLQVLAYAPFYFDGNYPGGGARFFADVLPVEHALLALAIATLASRRFQHAAFATLGVALAGFAIHLSFDHEQLADRDGGRPMFEPDVLTRANVAAGLVFVDTDHGFSLAHDPEANVKKNVLVARLRNDDRDRLLFDKLDHPPTYLYKFETPKPAAPADAPPSPPSETTASVAPWAPPAFTDSMRFETEAEWPPLAQSGGFAAPAFTEGCASQTRALVVTPSTADGTASATVSVPVPEAGRYSVVPRIVHGAHVPHTEPRGQGHIKGGLRFEVGAHASPANAGKPAVWSWNVANHGCLDLQAIEVDLAPPSATVVIEATGGPVAVDKITLRKIPTKR